MCISRPDFFEFWYNEPDMSGNFLKYLVLPIIFFLTWGLSFLATAGEATEAVTHLQASLIEIMKKGEDLGYKGRHKIIAPIVEKTHDIPYIARLAIGRHWKSLDAKQRSTFTQTFRELSVSTYAGRFDGFNGEKFSFLSEKSLPRGNRKVVSSDFTKSDGEKIRFNYILHQVKGQWKIINITVNGVSDLALKRVEYGGILKKEGFPTLIEKLETQIQENVDGL